MTDAEMLAAFDATTLDLAAFHHEQHLRVAWLCLRAGPAPADAIARYCAGLRRLARAAGHPGVYHETITVAFLLLVHERMARAGADGATWVGFARANPDLLAWKPSILDRYYRAETLASDLARRVFVMPDRLEAARPAPAPAELG